MIIYSTAEDEVLTSCRADSHCAIPHAWEIGHAHMFFVVKNQRIVLTLFAFQGPLYEIEATFILTTSSDITRRLNSSAISAMPCSSFRVNTLPTGL